MSFARVDSAGMVTAPLKALYSTPAWADPTTL